MNAARLPAVWVSSEHTFGAAETLKPHGENHMKYRQFLMAFCEKCGIAAGTPDRPSFSLQLEEHRLY